MNLPLKQKYFGAAAKGSLLAVSGRSAYFAQRRQPTQTSPMSCAMPLAAL